MPPLSGSPPTRGRRIGDRNFGTVSTSVVEAATPEQPSELGHLYDPNLPLLGRRAPPQHRVNVEFTTKEVTIDLRASATVHYLSREQRSAVCPWTNPRPMPFFRPPHRELQKKHQHKKADGTSIEYSYDGVARESSAQCSVPRRLGATAESRKGVRVVYASGRDDHIPPIGTT